MQNRLFLVWCGLTWIAGAVSAAPTLRIEVDPFNLPPYDVFQENSTGIVVSMTVEFVPEPDDQPKGDKEDSEQKVKRFFVTFSSDQPGYQRVIRSGSESLSYQCYRDQMRSVILKDLPDASVQEVLSGRIAKDTPQVRLSFYLEVPALQHAPPGFYSSPLEITLYEGDLSRHTLLQREVVNVSLYVPPKVRLQVVETGSEGRKGRIDFGTLEDGKTADFELLLQANTAFSVSAQSHQGGVLRHSDPQDNSQVPYILTLRGATVPLGKDEKPLFTVSAGSRTTRVPGKISIGKVGNPTPGTYGDSITFTITAN